MTTSQCSGETEWTFPMIILVVALFSSGTIGGWTFGLVLGFSILRLVLAFVAAILREVMK